MCFDRDSVPPVPPISGASVDRHELVLEARDGNRFAAFGATPVEASGAGRVSTREAYGGGAGRG